MDELFIVRGEYRKRSADTTRWNNQAYCYSADEARIEANILLNRARKGDLPRLKRVTIVRETTLVDEEV